MKKIAVFPGSFDPFTIGHFHLIKKALYLFDHIIIAVGTNVEKKYLFTSTERTDAITKIYLSHNNISVKAYSGLTIDFCKENNAPFIIRGLRNSNDFIYEQAIAQMNSNLNADIETIFLTIDQKYNHISSTIVRELYKAGADISPFLPKPI